jgi:ABC-type nitrate/sulfonate/bicarbonate transport system permease component
LWELVVIAGFLPRYLVPSFTDVLRALYYLIYTGVLPGNYAMSALRALLGFVLGTTVGIALGVSISAKSIQNLVQPVVTLLFTVPSVAWVPILIVWIGIKEIELPLATSFICSFPPVLYGTINSFRTVDIEQVEVARILGAKPRDILFRVVMPQVFLKLLPVIKVEAVMVWKTVFVTEMVALSTGLGYLAMVYATTLDMDKLLASIAVLSLTTLAIVQGFDYIESRFSRKWLGGVAWSR